MNTLVPTILVAVLFFMSTYGHPLEGQEQSFNGELMETETPFMRSRRDVEPTTYLDSDEPTKVLVKRLANEDEECSVVKEIDQNSEGGRHKRACVRVTVIKVCNKKTGRCGTVVVRRRC